MEPFLTKNYCFQSFHQNLSIKSKMKSILHSEAEILSAKFSEIATKGFLIHFWFHLVLESITPGFTAAFKFFYSQK